MAVLKSDGLHLQVGDGASSEIFMALAGVELKRLEIQQALIDSDAVRADAWAVGATTVDRRLTLECQAMATDAAAANRIRSLAVVGSPGNFVLALNDSEEMVFSAFVSYYREVIEAGSVKRLQFKLESTGIIAFA